MDRALCARPADAHGPNISRGAAANGPTRAMRRSPGESGNIAARLVSSTIARRAASRASSRRSAALAASGPANRADTGLEKAETLFSFSTVVRWLDLVDCYRGRLSRT